MSSEKPNGCGCANIPISVILLCLGASYWAYSKYGLPNLSLLRSRFQNQQEIITPTPVLPETSITQNPDLPSAPLVSSAPLTEPASKQSKEQSTKQSNELPTTPQVPKANNLPDSPLTIPAPEKNKPQPTQPIQPVKPVNKWQQKKLRGIYFSRYQITNNASEQLIRDRVRYYKAQGFNTLIHGVWGNACTMYHSQVMQRTLGFKSCPNLFRADWLHWLIDEAHQQGMQVHAYFEKGIKIDRNSPIYNLAVKRNWLVPGVDRTYAGIDHYVLDVANPEVSSFFRNIMAEFVQLYPKIDAVQWDDYLGYHAELPGNNRDRTKDLSNFVKEIVSATKQANPQVNFDICHHNPYWAKRYFAADWENWGVDRIFIQAYNEKGFTAELNYVKKYDGIAITDNQFHRLPELLEDSKVQSIFVFPLAGRPEETALELKNLVK